MELYYDKFAYRKIKIIDLVLLQIAVVGYFSCTVRITALQSKEKLIQKQKFQTQRTHISIRVDRINFCGSVDVLFVKSKHCCWYFTDEGNQSKQAAVVTTTAITYLQFSLSNMNCRNPERPLLVALMMSMGRPTFPSRSKTDINLSLYQEHISTLFNALCKH